MYAIVKTGGKQYRVEAGRTLEVERLPVGEGETVELSDVLMIADDGDVTIGTPIIEGARVMAHVAAHGRAPKIVVFKYKSKVRSRKKSGHRQGFTRLAVEEILRPGEEAKVRERVPADGNLDSEEEAAEAIVAQGAKAEAKKPRPRRAAPATAGMKAAKAETPKRTSRPAAKPKAEAAPRAKAVKPAAKAKAPAKAKAKTDDKPKAPGRRLPLRRKKETE